MSGVRGICWPSEVLSLAVSVEDTASDCAFRFSHARRGSALLRRKVRQRRAEARVLAARGADREPAPVGKEGGERTHMYIYTRRLASGELSVDGCACSIHVALSGGAWAQLWVSCRHWVMYQHAGRCSSRSSSTAGFSRRPRSRRVHADSSTRPTSRRCLRPSAFYAAPTQIVSAVLGRQCVHRLLRAKARWWASSRWRASG